MSKIFPTTYKDIYAVCVETDMLSARFLPHDGSKLASLVDKVTGAEMLAQNIGSRYKRINIQSSYVDGECSAFDDMFPTIDPAVSDSGVRKGLEYSDHGEVCRSSFDHDIAGDMLVMSFKSLRMMYSYTKTITGHSDGSINIYYEIENLADGPFPYLWAGHCMLAAEEGNEVITPFPPGAQAEIMFDSECLYGICGDPLKIERDILTSKKFSPNGNTYKFYYKDKLPDGYVGYRNGKLDRTIYLSFDRNILPYLGIWINNGSFKGMHNTALEPSSRCGDIPDMSDGGAAIGPKGILRFEINIKII